MPNEPALDMAHLKRLAERIRHKHWRVDYDPRVDGAHQIVDERGFAICFMATDGEDNMYEDEAELIAAASPSTMLRLLALVPTADQLRVLDGYVQEAESVNGITSSSHNVRHWLGNLITALEGGVTHG